MKSLRKVLVVAVLAIGTMGVSAQTSTWGVKAGLNLSSVEGLSNAKYSPGFNVGVVGQFMFVAGFGLETGLNYSMLSNKVEAGESSGISPQSLIKDDGTYHSSYIQVPVRLMYKFNTSPSLTTPLYVYPSVGMYVGYGLGGSDSYFDAFERFDLGLDLGLNVQYDHFTIGLGWQRGLLKVWENQDAFNSNVMLNVGYLF